MSSPVMLYTAVVIEYFDSTPGSTEISNLVSKYSNLGLIIMNPERLASMPPGSILGRFIDYSEKNDLTVFYPLLSHINMPIKPGEQFFALYGSSVAGDRIGYWITRKPADLFAEDPNYTHNDRSNADISLAKQFPDNGRSGLSYQRVIDNADSYQKNFQGEVVPRYFTKNSDLSLQGSNNSLIVLGSNSTLGTKSEGSGLIDIVVGRGQTSLTAPTAQFKNSRQYNESDKTIVPGNKKEGDLDLINDLSRVHVSMNMNPDEALGIKIGEKLGSGPTALIKSDKVRVTARSDLKITSEDEASRVGIVLNDGNVILTSDSGASSTHVIVETAQSFQKELGEALNEIVIAFAPVGTLPKTTALALRLLAKQFSSKITRSD